MKKVIEIEGMHCMGCVKRVENALHEFKDSTVSVSLEDGTATIDTPCALSDADLTEAIEDLGFDVIKIHD